jgi:hypothetical protein
MNDLSITQAAGLAAYDGAPTVRDFPVTIRRITTTDDGRLQLVLEAQSLDAENLAQVQRMLELQRGTSLLTLESAQGNLFDEVPATEKAPRAQ